MIQSMTGFGKAIVSNNTASISVEVRSLNSKLADINMRLPKLFNSKELDIRNILQKSLERGKIGLTIDYTPKIETNIKSSIDQQLLLQYYKMLQNAANMVGEKEDNLFKIALSMPEVLKNNNLEEENEEDWQLLQAGLQQAIQQMIDFRIDEGNSLKVALISYINAIHQYLEVIKTLLPTRKEAVIIKIRDQINQLKVEINEDRFEQELIYYLEKLDISEEIVRLSTHLNYFTEELNANGSGKKLGFISQEIGREINTIGSKANYAEMQKAVILMKEELEKIKEQVLNVI